MSLETKFNRSEGGQPDISAVLDDLSRCVTSVHDLIAEVQALIGSSTPSRGTSHARKRARIIHGGGPSSFMSQETSPPPTRELEVPPTGTSEPAVAAPTGTSEPAGVPTAGTSEPAVAPPTGTSEPAGGVPTGSSEAAARLTASPGPRPSPGTLVATELALAGFSEEEIARRLGRVLSAEDVRVALRGVFDR